MERWIASITNKSRGPSAPDGSNGLPWRIAMNKKLHEIYYYWHTVRQRAKNHSRNSMNWNKWTFPPILKMLLLPIAVWSIQFVWRVTTFFYNELMHQSLMAAGDSELPFCERFGNGLVWLPLCIVVILWLWFYAVILWQILVNKTRSKN
jgi:hypothetical protein